MNGARPPASPTPGDRWTRPQQPDREYGPWATTLVVLGTIVLLAGVIVLIASSVHRTTALPTPAPSPSPSKSPAPTERSEQDVVRDYFEALAAGDVERALALGDLGGSGSTVMLSEEAHALLRTQSPIEQVQVVGASTDGDAAAVEVRYRLGGNDVSTEVPVLLDGQGSHLARTTVTIAVVPEAGSDVPLLLAGTPVPPDTALEVVPGVYTLSTGLPFIEYPAEQAFVVDGLRATDTAIHPATPQLSALGSEAFRTAVQRALEGCLAQRDTEPGRCPQRAQLVEPIDSDSIRWELLGNPLAGVEPSLDPERASEAMTELELMFRLTHTPAGSSSPTTQEVPITAAARADMTGTDEAAIDVRWEILGRR